MIRFLALIVLCISLFAANANAQDRSDIEQRANALYPLIRCPVCEAQTIDSSDTDTAKDLRALVVKKLENGQTEDEILNELRTAYGDSIVMTPPIQSNTALLWLAPFLIFIIGGAVCAFTIVKKSKARP